MNHQAFLPPAKDRNRWNARGLNAAQERAFHWMVGALILTIGLGWAWSIWTTWSTGGEVTPFDDGARPFAAPVARSIRSALSQPSSASMAFLNEAVLRYSTPLRGHSGSLRAVIGTPGEEIAEATDPGVEFRVGEDPQGAPELRVPAQPGVHPVALEFDRLTRGFGDLNVITLVPFAEKRRGRIGTYLLGTWPYESGGKPRSAAYANPKGFVEVTPENRDLYVSEHFQLGDFLTKGQEDVWPKYILLDPRLLDKLELMIAELKAMGADVRDVTVMSGFRTPHYNEGGGNTSGRANLSRHMYGDGADVFVDNDGDNWTDDINGDGKVDTRDAEMMAKAAERAERKYPSLVGGIGTYGTCCGHGPFVHLDVRGYRARWRGSGSG